MLKLTPLSSSKFEGAVELSDLPSELHAGLKRYAAQVAYEPDDEGRRLVAVDFEGAAGDQAEDAVVRAMLQDSARQAPVNWGEIDTQGYAAHLLAARHLQTVLGSNVVFRDRVAIRV